MKEVNAVDLRRSLTELARQLAVDKQPILIKRGQKPVAVIISLQDFQERFTLQAAQEKRQALLKEILQNCIENSSFSSGEQHVPLRNQRVRRRASSQDKRVQPIR
jgi:PHD/YefM family antitoxin component YafN of YafNO toxin-antitoxin module